MSVANLPLSPQRTAETDAYWDAANEGRLLLKRCPGTDKAFHPPRDFSPFTGRPDTEWIEAEGTGTLYSYSVSMVGGEPHCIAYVQLTEGPIILSALIEYAPSEPRIGQALKVVFRPSRDGQMLPFFTPVS
ncbi:Zn-ribbon domain-containing OB-fold protein [Pararhodobacter marinus]|uniref:Zn-ribbon domain-containing OB-fold protein n=1 Tax=Pararhodobacter marinus TaxID=2184063 RepID=UPI0035190817